MLSMYILFFLNTETQFQKMFVQFLASCNDDNKWLMK